MNVEKSVLMIEISLFVFHSPHYIKAILMPVCFIWYFPVVVETGRIWET